MPGDERTKRIAELRELKEADFVLRDKMDFSQADVETWGDVVADMELEGKKPNLARLRRVALTAAHKAGWFATCPELGDDDYLLLPPRIINSVGDRVLLLYNEIISPDESFT